MPPAGDSAPAGDVRRTDDRVLRCGREVEVLVERRDAVVLCRIGRGVGDLLWPHHSDGREPDRGEHHHAERPVERQPVEVRGVVRIGVERTPESEHGCRDGNEHDQVLPPDGVRPDEQSDRRDREDQVDELDGERAGRGRHEERRELARQTEPVERVAVETDQDQDAPADRDHEVANPRGVVPRCLREERRQQAVATEGEVAAADGDADRERKRGCVEDHDQVDNGREP
jgi:hypothetical protein